jgi:hypothetical protein
MILKNMPMNGQIKGMDKEKVIQTNILLPESLWVRAKMRAIEERISLTGVVRNAVEAYLVKPQRKREGRNPNGKEKRS